MNHKQVNCGHCGTEMDYNGLFDVGDGASPLYSCPKCLDVIEHFPTRVRLLELVLRSVYEHCLKVDPPTRGVSEAADKTFAIVESIYMLVENALDEDKEAAVMDMLKMDGTISE